MWYGLLADLIVVLHFAYVGFVVVGQLLICLGVVLRWQWVRNLWFRLVHLLAISLVALEAVVGMTCPLTTWEYELRRLAGQEVAAGTFVGRCLRRSRHRHILHRPTPLARARAKARPISVKASWPVDRPDMDRYTDRGRPTGDPDRCSTTYRAKT